MPDLSLIIVKMGGGKENERRKAIGSAESGPALRV
jgi:hypothetical protein